MTAFEGRIPTNLRNLLIIEALAEAGRPLTPTEINRTVGLPKQTVHRLCHNLEVQGFLVREAGANRYGPSRRLRAMFSGVMMASKNNLIRNRVLESVSQKIGETCNLVMAGDGGMVYLERVETQWPLRIQLPIGSQVPFHCTASGKMYLSTFETVELEFFLKSYGLRSYARNTIVDAEQLKAELGRTAERQYSEDNEEFIDGMVAIAVPIRDTRNRFLAALAFHAPVQRMSIATARDHIATLIDGAALLAPLLVDREDAD